jgi:hypothetical protein
LNLEFDDNSFSTRSSSSLNLANVTLPPNSFNSNSNLCVTSTSSSSDDSYKEIECLDDNILIGNNAERLASKPQRFAYKSKTERRKKKRDRDRDLANACLAMEEYRSDSENEDAEPCIDDLINEINNHDDNDMMVGSFSDRGAHEFRSNTSNKYSPAVVNSPRLVRKLAKCVCKIKCKCQCHRLQASGTNSKTSSHCSSQIFFDSLSLDWEDVDLDLVHSSDGKTSKTSDLIWKLIEKQQSHFGNSIA